MPTRYLTRLTTALGIAASLITAAAFAMGSGPAPQTDEAAVLARIKPVAQVEFEGGAAGETAAAGKNGASAPGKSGAEIVKTTCSVCHASGVAGAPKIGDNAAWAPRMAPGLETMVKIATEGKGAMPPKGGADVNTAELTSAIIYMANKSGGSFKMPAGSK